MANMICRLATFAFLFCGFSNICWSQTIEISLRSKALHRGKPIFFNDNFVALLKNDGRIVTFGTSEAEDFKQLSGSFRSLNPPELRAQLRREFGKDYEVSGTGQYLVVHPVGQRDRWTERFEELYRSMLHYFSVRGFSTRPPEFPFIAIVFPTQMIYQKYLRDQKVKIGFDSLGYYDQTSNRVHLYDVTGGQNQNSGWHLNESTVIHEAAHQTAFNIGIHRRYGDDPIWIVEGIGTMFEAKGVWNSRWYKSLGDRINRRQLENYRETVTQSTSLQILQQQILSNGLFDQQPKLAYAHAWALTFYLTEKEPVKFAEFLRRIRRRKAFSKYSPKERLADFQQVFGSDLQMFDARFQRFMATLR